MPAFLKYRVSLTPTVPVSNTVKGSPLTNLEIDGNFKSIADDLTLIRTGNGASGTWAISVSGNAATSTLATNVTNAGLSGEASSSGTVVTLSNSAVISKVLTGYSASPGVVSASDSILTAIQKIIGNSATFVTSSSLTSTLSSYATTASLSSYATTASLSSYAPLANPAFTGVPTAPTAALSTNTTQIATTAFVIANSGGGGGGATRAVRAYSAFDLGLTSATSTLVPFDTISWQIGTDFSDTTKIFTPTQAGKYQISAKVSLINTTLTVATLQIFVNNAVASRSEYVYTTSPANIVTFMVFDTFDLPSGSTGAVKIQLTGTGTGLSIKGTSVYTNLQITKIA